MVNILYTYFKPKRKFLFSRLVITLAVVLSLGVGIATFAVLLYPNNDSEKELPTTITVYTALLPEQIDNYLNVFRHEHPMIKVNIVRKTTAEITAQFLEEKENPKADVVWGVAATSLLLFEWNNMIMPYKPEGVERVDIAFRDTMHPPSWVGHDIWMTAFCSNTDELERLSLEPPTSWKDLTKIEYINHVAFANPATSGTGYMNIIAILQHYGEAEGWAMLDQIHENVFTYVGPGEVCELVANGDVPIGVSYDLAALSQREAGNPITITFPEDGAGWDMETSGLVKKYPINPASQIFLDWAISDNAMREYGKNYLITTVDLDEVAPPDGFPSDPASILHDKDSPRAAANHDQIIETWIARYGDKISQE